MCAILAVFDWRMAFSMFLMLSVSALILLLSRRLQSRLFSRHVEARLDAEKQTQEYLDGIKVIRACGLGGERFQALNHAFLELKRAAIQVELASGSLMALSTMLLRSGIGIVAFVGVNLIASGQIDFLVLLMFLLIVSRIYGPILTVLTMLPDLLYLKVSTGRLCTLMESKPMAGRSDVTLTNMRNFSFVFQDVTLFNDTIEENIRFGRPDASEEESHAAARFI